MKEGLFLPVFVLLGAACSTPAPAIGEGAQAIVGGTPDGADPAVVMLVSYPADLHTFSSCTASLVAQKVLLTAAHCVDAQVHGSETFGVFTGADASAYPTAELLVPQLRPVATLHPHPDYDRSPPFSADIAVVELPEALAATPLPLNREALDASFAGTAARIVGYGQAKYDVPNAAKQEASTVVKAVDAADTITVGDAQHRSCVGDSGGPVLVKMGGVETIVGVDSYTDLKGCLEPAHYRRTDTYQSFLDGFVPPPAGAGGSGGSSAGEGGSSGAESGGGCDVGRGPAGAGQGIGLLGLLAAFVARRKRRG